MLVGDITPEQITAIIVAMTSLIAAIGAVVSAIYGKQAKTHAIDASNSASDASTLAGDAKRAAVYTVSQTAAIQQTIKEHCGAICPAITCPLRRMEERTT